MLYHDRDFSVATGFGYSVSRHSLGVATGPGLWAVSRQVCAQRTTEELCHDRKFSVAIENYLLRQALQCFLE